MANSEKWYFTKEELENTPSRKYGYNSREELYYRQKTANLIQDMGNRLRVSLLCICTAIVYMHRFYTLHPFTLFAWQQMAPTTLYLAGKAKEELIGLKHVVRVATICLYPENIISDLDSEWYTLHAQDIMFNENVLLATLGFDLEINIPHSYIERYCQLEETSKDLTRIACFIATNSLHLTTMCLQYKSEVVACFCIDVARKRCRWKTPLLNENKKGYSSVDPTVTAELLQQLTKEFHVILESCPSSLREKFKAITDNVSHTFLNHMDPPFDTDPKKVIREDGKQPHLHRSPNDTKSGSEADPHKHRPSRPHEANSNNQQQQKQECKMRMEWERLAAQRKALMSGQSEAPHSHHSVDSSVDPKSHSRPRSVESYQLNSSTEPIEASINYPFELTNEALKDPTLDYLKKSVSTHDITSAYLNKSLNSTSTNVKSPFSIVDSKQIHQIPDVMSSLPNVRKKLILDEFEKEVTNEAPGTSNNTKPSDIPSLPTDEGSESLLVNSLEAISTIIHNILKETPSVSHLPEVAVVEASSLQLHPNHKSKKKHKRKKKSKGEKKKKSKNKDCGKHKQK